MSAAAPGAWRPGPGAALLGGSCALTLLCWTLSRAFAALLGPAAALCVVALAVSGVAVGALAAGGRAARPRSARDADASWPALLLALALLGFCVLFALLSLAPAAAEALLAPLDRHLHGAYSAGEQAQPGPWALLRMAVLSLVAAPAFVLGGFEAGMALERARTEAPVAGALALTGAGLGCLAAPALLARLDPFALVAALAALAALTSWLLARPRRGMAALAGLAAALATVLAARPGPAGGVGFTMVFGRHLPDAGVVRWDADSRVAVWPLGGAAARDASWIGAGEDPQLPAHYGLSVDDAGHAPIVGHRPGEDLAWTRRSLLSLPYAVRPMRRALVLGPGGGRDILIALGGGAAAVDAVEPNPLVVRMAQSDFGDFSGGPYALPGVTVVVSEARAFLGAREQTYDVIQAPTLLGRLSPGGGVLLPTRDGLFTVEGLHLLLQRLAPGGVLALSTFQHENVLLRLVATARETLEQRGAADPAGHVFAASGRGTIVVLVKAEPFAAEEVGRLLGRCADAGFDVVHAPGLSGNSFVSRLLAAADARELLAGLPFDAAPLDDDRPFLHQTLRAADLVRGGGPGAPGLERPGMPALPAAAGLLALLAAICLALPLAPRVAGGTGRAAGVTALAYFSAIGAASAAAACGLLRQVTALSGASAASAAAVCAVMLASAAAGSSAAGRVDGGGRLLRRRCAGLAIVLLLVCVLAPAGLAGLEGSPAGARFAAAAAAVALVGYLLGLPLPAGLVTVRSACRPAISLAVYASFAVLGSVASLALALAHGQTQAMLVGPAGFVVAGALAELLE